MKPAKLCSCGDPLDRPGQRYCRKCHAGWMRGHRRRHSELSPEARRKANCRSYTNVLIRRGKLRKGPCQVCGRLDVQAVHVNYDDPRHVHWLCLEHRLDYHRESG